MADRHDRRAEPTVTLTPLPRRATVNLRCDPARKASLQAASDAFGIALPGRVGDLAEGGDRVAIRLGPDEWLLVAPDGEQAALEERLLAALEDDPLGAACDVSHNYSGFLLAGPRAASVLARGCPLDFGSARCGPGRAAESLLAAAPALFTCLVPGRYEIRVRNSYAAYASAWLADAMAEFLPPA